SGGAGSCGLPGNWRTRRRRCGGRSPSRSTCGRGFPQRVSGDWVVGGRLTFSSPEGAGPDFAGEVLAYQPQSLVEFRWGTDVIRLELAGRPGGRSPPPLGTLHHLGEGARDAGRRRG